MKALNIDVTHAQHDRKLEPKSKVLKKTKALDGVQLIFHKASGHSVS